MAARDLARKGYRVLILEEHAEIGVPVHCSGLVTPRTLEAAGVDESLVINRIKGAVIYSPTGRRLEVGGDRVRALVIDRLGLDRTLAAQAQEAGAALELRSRVTAIERKNGHVHARVERPGSQPTQVEARLLVGAFGSHWAPALDGRPARKGSGVLALGGDAQVYGMRSDMVEVYLGYDVSPGWFGWVIPVEGGRARVGVGAANGSGPLPRRIGRLRAHRPGPSEFQVLRLTGSVIPVYRRRKLYSDCLMLVGDAARQVKPTSGGGIYAGITGAQLCAQVAAAALEKDDCSAVALAPYQKVWERTLHRDLHLGFHLRRMLESFSPREVDALMAAMERPRMKALLLAHGDIDYMRPLFGRLMSLPAIAPALLSLPPGIWWKVLGETLRWKLERCECLRGE